MAHRADAAPEANEPLYTQPWPLVGAGLALAVAAWLQPQVWASAPERFAGPWRFFVLVAAGIVLLAAAVSQLRRTTWDWPARVESAALISLCGIGAIVGYLALDREWVSGKVLLGALFVLCLAGTILVLLPSVVRRIVLSLFVLFHFAGIGVAVTLVDPPGDTGPWVVKQLWSWVYRPYLSFLYLTNAYHFYSPNPGPPSLLWFAVHYDDGSYTWHKIPERSDSPIGMHYQRMLALPEHSYAAAPRLPLWDQELLALNLREREQKRKETILPGGTWQQIHRRRYDASLNHTRYALKDHPGEGLPIPYIREEDMNFGSQYREPTEYSKQILASVARRVFWNAPPPAREGARVRSVKMYRVVGNIVSPAELAAGMDPNEKTKHWAYFLGEYDGDGKLLDPTDPFLYWFLPIVYVPKEYPNDTLSRSRRDLPAGKHVMAPLPSLMPFSPAPKKDEGFLLDCLEMHAAGPLHVPAKPKPEKDKGKAPKEKK